MRRFNGLDSYGAHLGTHHKWLAIPISTVDTRQGSMILQPCHPRS